MVTRARARPRSGRIDWSTFPASDGKPMAETYPNVIQMVDLLLTLPALFAGQGRGGTTVGGNQFVYYNPFNGRDNISPDVYVAFNRPPPAPPKWQTWIEGAFPDVVFEITSPSTQRKDLSLSPKGKRALYAQLGAREYYVYDPQGEMDPVLQGFERRGDVLEPLPPTPSGGIYSPLMGAELRPVAMGVLGNRPAGVWLRVFDPATGQPIPLAEEEHYDLQAERLARAAAEQRAGAEERARLRAEAELQALRAALARRHTPDPDIEARAEGQEG